MELSEAFGKFFPSAMPVQEEPQPKPVVQEPVEPVVPKRKPQKQKTKPVERELGFSKRYLGMSDISEIDPRFYMINIQIAQDDCHLICVFLLVLILSFLLTKKN